MSKNLEIEDTVEVAVAPKRTKAWFEERRVRHGKTRNDHASGAWKRRLDNLELRAAWINETRGKHYGSETAVPVLPVAHGLSNSSLRRKIKSH